MTSPHPSKNHKRRQFLLIVAPEEFEFKSAPTLWKHRDWKAPIDGASFYPTVRESLFTYKAIVAVRYPELVQHDQKPMQSGHFVSHDHTVEHRASEPFFGMPLETSVLRSVAL